VKNRAALIAATLAMAGCGDAGTSSSEHRPTPSPQHVTITAVTTTAKPPVGCATLQGERSCGQTAKSNCLKYRTKKAERGAIYLNASSVGKKLLNELHRQCRLVGVNFNERPSEEERTTIKGIEAKEGEEEQQSAEAVHERLKREGRAP
jgi:hypothetical protein